MTLFPRWVPAVHGPRINQELAEWAGTRIPHVGKDGFGSCWAVGLAHEKQLRAVIVFSEWMRDEGTVQVSLVADRWRGITRAMIGEVLGAAFEGRGGLPAIRKAWTATPHTLSHVIRFNERTGFKREAVLREHYAPRVHAVVCGMMAREWRRKYRTE